MGSMIIIYIPTLPHGQFTFRRFADAGAEAFYLVTAIGRHTGIGSPFSIIVLFKNRHQVFGVRLR